MGKGANRRQIAARRERQARELGKTIAESGLYMQRQEEEKLVTVPSAPAYPGVRVEELGSGRTRITATQVTENGLELHEPNSRGALEAARAVVAVIERNRAKKEA